MRFILTQTLAVHWLLTFAIIAAVALGADGSITGLFRSIAPFSSGDITTAASPYALVITGGVAVICATVAAMFLWTLLMIRMGESDELGEAYSVSVLAHTGAICAVSVMMTLFAGLGAAGAMLPAGLMIAALSASFAAMSYEWRGANQEGEAVDIGQAAARMMALGAAHTTVLSNITGRGRSD